MSGLYDRYKYYTNKFEATISTLSDRFVVDRSDFSDTLTSLKRRVEKLVLLPTTAFERMHFDIRIAILSAKTAIRDRKIVAVFYAERSQGQIDPALAGHAACIQILSYCCEKLQTW